MTVVTNRYLNSIFCDDVRQEVGNKMSYIGVYRSGMDVAPGDPSATEVVLPKLCVILTAQTPKQNPFKSLKFRILKDDEVLQEFDVPDEALLSASKKLEDPLTPGFHTFGAVVTIQPFSVGSSFKLRVRAITESEELAGSALKVNFHRTQGEPQPADSV